MTTTTQERTGTKAVIAAMLFFAIGQFVSPVFNALLGGSFTTSNRNGEPPLTPAGYTFSIWGLIEVVSVAFAIYLVLRRKKSDADLIDRLAVPLLVVFAGFSVWILAAELEPVWSTLVVIVIMFVALVRALQIALAERSRIAGWPRLGRALLWWTLGLYAGWLSVAMWLNLTTAFAGSGAPITGALGIAAQIATLAGALGTVLVILAWTGGLLSYAVAVCWGLVGAIIGTLDAGQPALTIAVVIGLIAVVVATVVTRRRSRSSSPSAWPEPAAPSGHSCTLRPTAHRLLPVPGRLEGAAVRRGCSFAERPRRLPALSVSAGCRGSSVTFGLCARMEPACASALGSFRVLTRLATVVIASTDPR